ncbi:hypothetical protein DH2020_033869 [Rehmannia glutinosa]|uniref:MYND-type domain-containing protein n=1 Tax=Rehmannia glutinosa TaxID=99300 RepID=A0ABR0VCU0_REHGL
MDELQNALNNKSLTISTFPEKGRCLFTTRDFSPGEVIISESPYVSVPNKNKESPESKCEWCFSSTNLKKCSACHVVWYCSSICQKSDWKLHCVECQALKKVDKERLKSITPSIRLMVRLCIRRKLENQKVSRCFEILALVLEFAACWCSLLDMSDVNEKQLVLYAQMANLVNLILQWPDSEINIKEIAEIFSKNLDYGGCGAEQLRMHFSAFMFLACNAHTICDSELRPLGTGLYPVISIINHSLMFKGQSDDIRESAILEGYRCKDNECNGFLLRDSVKMGDEKGRGSLKSSDKTEASVAYKMIEELQMKLYHPFSVNLMRTRETLLKTDNSDLLELLGETEAAVKSLTKALDILRITHGTKTPFMLELLSKLEEARAEASYMLRSQNED